MSSINVHPAIKSAFLMSCLVSLIAAAPSSAQKLDAATIDKFKKITEKADAMNKNKGGPPANEQYMTEAQKLQEAGDLDGAIKKLTNSIAWKDSQEAYAMRASYYHEKGDNQNAVKDYESAFKLAPKPGGGFPKQALLTRYAEALEATGQHDKAVVAADDSIKVDPKDPLPYEFKGSALYSLGKHDKAVEALSKAIGLEPAAARHQVRALSYSALGKFPEAKKDLDAAIKLEPKDDFYVNDRARLWMKMGKYPEALADAKKALAMSKSGINLMRVAQCDLALGNGKQAVAGLSQAIAMGPADVASEATYYRSLAYKKLKDDAKAKADAAKATSLGYKADTFDKSFAAKFGI